MALFGIKLPSHDKNVNIAFLENKIALLDRALDGLDADDGMSDAFAFTDPDNLYDPSVYAAAYDALRPSMFYAMVKCDGDGVIRLREIFSMEQDGKRRDFDPDFVARLRASGIEKIGVVSDHFADILGSCAKMDRDTAQHMAMTWVESDVQTTAATRADFADNVRTQRDLYAQALEKVRAMSDTPLFPPSALGGPAP